MFWELLTTLGIIVVLGFLIVFVVNFFRLRFQVIPEDERWVIYRLGRFKRVAGPGWTFIPVRLDKVVRKYNIRPHPVTVAVESLMIHGTPFGYSLSFWVRADLEEAAKKLSGGLKPEDQLLRLTMMSETEIYNEARVKVRNAFHKAIGEIEKAEPLPPKADFAQALLPVFPGLPPCNRLLDKVRTELEAELPKLGVFLEPLHPFTILALNLGDDILNSFSRDRMARIVRERFPSLSDHDILLAISAMVGSPLHEQRIRVDGAGAIPASVELRDDENNRRIKLYPGGAAQSGASAANATDAQTPPPTPSPEKAQREPPLTRDDLSILRRVPQASGGRRPAS